MVKLNPRKPDDMMAIIKKIDQYMSRFDWPYSDWVVGVSPDPRQTLERTNMVAEAMGPWIYKMAANADFAKAIERHFVENLGTDGGAEDGERRLDARVVYAYRKGVSLN